jgi:hypothetical protein
VTRGSDARSPAQNHLAGHELAVVLTEHARERLISRITFMCLFYLAFAAACSINPATSFG